ncbi:oligosaccharide flippase family protein [Rhodococcus phenolicus]|uniref:oligosaccharide flippase family protein n=1 Tax=Rhodococcus phenolicus TaxID=263849 RepID=UPI00082F8C49|nr:oligosaccharide flippase family protein [Rhodococcus phenolicus]
MVDEEVAPEGSTADQVGSIGRKAGRGLRWSLLGNFFLKLGSFGIGLILARLLTPDDFGVYALALAVTALLMHVNDFGMIAAGVQWRGRFEEMAPTGSTIALVFSVLGYGVVWILAPAFASMANTPDAAPVVRLLALVIVVDGVTAMRVSALQRRFEQDRLTIAIMAGWSANAVLAVPLAFAGAGAYSFAGGQVFGSIVTGVFVFKAGHLPIGFAFDKAIALKLLAFGVPLAASLGVESILLNADYIIIGNALGSAAVGYYLLAFNISSWVPGLIGTAVRFVSIAGFSRLAERNARELEEGVRRSVPLLVTAILPIAVVMATLATPLIAFLYGDQWGPSAAVLRILAVLMIVRMVTSFALRFSHQAGACR